MAHDDGTSIIRIGPPDEELSAPAEAAPGS